MRVAVTEALVHSQERFTRIQSGSHDRHEETPTWSHGVKVEEETKALVDIVRRTMVVGHKKRKSNAIGDAMGFGRGLVVCLNYSAAAYADAATGKCCR